MHNLLKRQLRKLNIAEHELPDDDSWMRLLERVSSSYKQFDRDRYLLEHSMDVSSAEMQQLYNDLHEATEALLYVEKERSHITLQSIGDAVISTDADGKIQFMNGAAEKLTGWSADECTGKPVAQVFRTTSDSNGRKYRDPVVVAIRECRISNIPNHTLLVRRDLTEVPISGTIAPILGIESVQVGSVLVFSDISAETELRQRLEHQAHHDMLTGLCNRYYFEEVLGTLVVDACHGNSEHVLLYMDLDQFKIVNDTCGHVAGDEMLKRVCDVITVQIRSADTLARLGGDEFGLLLRNCSLENARQIAQNILDSVKQFRFNWSGRVFEVGISIGMVGITCDSGEPSAMLSAADIACYVAKESGRNRVHTFEQRDTKLESRKGEMRWATRITHALDEDRFVLFRQAIVPANGRVLENQHYEVLIRMQDPGGRLVTPAAFIPAAERFKLMPALDRWVISHTLEKLATNHELGSRTGMCAINLSGISLGDEGLLDFILEQIKYWHVNPRKLCFEITETAVISDLKNTRRLMDRLQLHGCRFALDDFGSGLSSFSYLKELPVDFLKIDGNFVRRIREDPVDMAMVTSINYVGHIMGIKTIAEFVENREVLQELAIIGVDYAQGYGIQLPVLMESPFADVDDGDLQQSVG